MKWLSQLLEDATAVVWHCFHPPTKVPSSKTFYFSWHAACLFALHLQCPLTSTSQECLLLSWGNNLINSKQMKMRLKKTTSLFVLMFWKNILPSYFISKKLKYAFLKSNIFCQVVHSLWGQCFHFQYPCYSFGTYHFFGDCCTCISTSRTGLYIWRWSWPKL